MIADEDRNERHRVPVVVDHSIRVHGTALSQLVRQTAPEWIKSGSHLIEWGVRDLSRVCPFTPIKNYALDAASESR